MQETPTEETLNIHAGTIIAESPSILGMRIRDNDWPDGDDMLRNDVNMQLPSGGRFTIDERDYDVTARVIGPVYKLLFDTLNVKNDRDFFGKGDIYVKYSVSNGMTTISGRWPRSGSTGFDDGETKPMNIEAAAFSKPTTDDQLTVRVRVMDDDLFSDDQLGNDAFVFTEADDFGADKVIQIQDGNSDYRVTFSIIGAPPPPQNPDPIID